MKFQHFFGFYLVFFSLLFELTSRTVYSVGAIRLLGAWIARGEAIVPVIFLAGAGGIMAVIFISARTHEVYMSIAAKPESYIFLGDRLTEGFYAYAENDPVKKVVFVPSFFDSNMYPAAGFNVLYKRMIVLRSPAGELAKFQFYHTGNLILWSLLHLATWLFCVLGFLLLFKSYGQLASIPETFAYINSKIGGSLTIAIILLTVIYISSLIVIKLATRNIKDDSGTVQRLPDAIHPGAILEGKVVAAETYTIKSTMKRSRPRFYRRYTLAFDSKSAFDPPVYLTWSEMKIFPETLVNTSRALKAELKLRQDYYGQAFEKLDEAKESGSYFPIQVTHDLSIIPYLEEKKQMIPALLAIDHDY